VDKAAGNFYLKTKGEIEDLSYNLVLQVFHCETFTLDQKNLDLGENSAFHEDIFFVFSGGLKNTNHRK
jgi:hypothetical protein